MSQPLKIAFYDNGNYESELEDLNESLGERLWGLTEFLPEWQRKAISTFVQGVVSCIRNVCSGSGMILSASVVLFAPIILEYERNHGSNPDNIYLN